MSEVSQPTPEELVKAPSKPAPKMPAATTEEVKGEESKKVARPKKSLIHYTNHLIAAGSVLLFVIVLGHTWIILNGLPALVPTSIQNMLGVSVSPISAPLGVVKTGTKTPDSKEADPLLENDRRQYGPDVEPGELSSRENPFARP